MRNVQQSLQASMAHLHDFADDHFPGR
jgi:hypothetical protein